MGLMHNGRVEPSYEQRPLNPQESLRRQRHGNGQWVGRKVGADEVARVCESCLPFVSIFFYKIRNKGIS